MIGGVALSLLAWAIAGGTGSPVDAFLPLAVAIGVKREVTVDVRLALAVVLAALTAVATGDAPLERAVLYVATAWIAGRVVEVLRDRPSSRALAAALGLGAVIVARHALSMVDLAPAPGVTTAAVAGTVAWTAAHAAISRRIPARPALLRRERST